MMSVYRCVSTLLPKFVGWSVGCLTCQQVDASVSQGRICSDKCTCCQTEIEAKDQTSYPTQSQYTDTGPISHSADPVTPDAWYCIATEVLVLKTPV